jgi:Flp pilus assembly protein TadG
MAAQGGQVGWRRRFRGLLRKAIRSERGTTAIEFGILALPFFALIVAILETGLVLLAQEVLQTATSRAARLIMTGQAQDASYTSAQFKQAVCNQASVMLSCSGIYVNVQTFSSFSSVTRLNPLQNGVFNPALVSYDAGGPGDIVLVQVFYQWPLVLGPLSFSLANTASGTRLMIGTAVFRNEPYA